MAYPVVRPSRFKLLPIVLASSISLVGCGADPTGNINSGSDGGLSGGGISTSAILLAGGLIGLGAILESSDDDTVTSPVVDSQSGDVNGADGDTSSDNTGGNGDSSDNQNNADTGNGDSGDNDSGNDGSGDDGNGDADSGNNDNSSQPSGQDPGPVNGSFEPPAWMNGMWRGTDAGGNPVIVYATSTDIGLGGETSVQSYSEIPGITSQVLQQSDNVYQYSVNIPSENGIISFTETWTNNGDGTALYTATGDRQAEFIVYRASATDFLAPPQWLQGDWEGNDYRATVSAGNIAFGGIGNEAINLYELASQDGAILLVHEISGSDYIIELITRDVTDKYWSTDFHLGLYDANSVTLASTALKTVVVMIRQ